MITSGPDYKAFARAGDGPATPSESKEGDGFFGEDGLSFGDVLDAINPLNHIPIVSDIFASLTGHKASAGSRLAGGALFGGPIGLVASLAGVIFEQEKGASPSQALYAALTGPAVPISQLAANEIEALTVVANIDENLQTPTAAPVEPVQLASLSPAAQAASSTIPVLEAAKNLAPAPPIPDQAAATLLDLYGASTVSAHSSYQKAQMLPYLRDVTVSKML